MKLRFGPEDDDDAFEQACDELLGRFQAAVPSADQHGAALALDWKRFYGDGDLATWRVADIEEFLIGWCPAKVSMPAGQAGTFPASLSSFFAFMAEQRLLGGGSDPLPMLHSHLSGIGLRFAAAMSDRTRFGMTKSIFAAVPGLDQMEGMEPEDFAGVMDQFNALSYEERSAILGLPLRPPSMWETLTDGIDLPPAPPRKPADSDAAGETAFLKAVATIREFVGDGRKLTAKGNLSVADAKDLAARLEDTALETYEEMSWNVRSADDLPHLQFLLRWARTAGAVKVANKKMSATASWARLDNLGALDRGVKALLDKGPVTIGQGPHRRFGDAIAEVIDEGAPFLLGVLWAMPERLPYEQLLDGVVEVCESAIIFGDRSDADWRRQQVSWDFDRFFDVLALAGVAAREGDERVKDHRGIERRRGGDLSLTRLGRVLLGAHLSKAGFDIPEVGAMAERPLADLFGTVGEWNAERTRAEFDLWVERHSPAQAVDEMTGVLTTYTDPQMPVAALDLAGRLPDAWPERAARRFLDTPAGGHASGWLIEHGHEDFEVDPMAMMRAGVEMLSMYADSGDDAELMEMVGNINEIESFIVDVEAVDIPAAGDLLEAIARVHPDPNVAKAARKAAMRQRSR